MITTDYAHEAFDVVIITFAFLVGYVIAWLGERRQK